MESFSSRLIQWQRLHGRHGLPWQGADAYRVWLSEVMLQQTQVVSVIPYFQRFLNAFPDVLALAAATEEQVLAHWSGLGYYARGRHLYRAAKIVATNFNGSFPRQFEELLELPGIGRSTAAAICALAYHEPRAILDGNVKRVLARHLGIAGWTGSPKIEAELWRKAETLLPTESIAIYTQGLMDLGATVCTRSKPKCVLCPVQSDCEALLTERTHELPSPRPHKPIPEKYAVMLIIKHENQVLLAQRPSKGIWGGMWGLPQFDDEAHARNWFEMGGMAASEGVRLAPFTHTFTHFKLHIAPLKIVLVKKPLQLLERQYVWFELEQALETAIPTPVRRLLSEM